MVKYHIQKANRGIDKPVVLNTKHDYLPKWVDPVYESCAFDTQQEAVAMAVESGFKVGVDVNIRAYEFEKSTVTTTAGE